MKLNLVPVLVAALMAHSAAAAPVALEFLPPDIEPQDVCVAPETTPEADLETEGGDHELTNVERLRFIRSDIRRYTNDDADRYFDFILRLIGLQEELDETFTTTDARYAQLELLVHANRLDQLQQEALVETLARDAAGLSNSQKLALAQYYATGIGIEKNIAMAQSLIREAAYDGSAEALLEIVRLEQQGELVDGWDAPLDLTVTMAFGGLLGQMDRGICRRAMRIGDAYHLGTAVAARPDLALAWYRFAADLGGGTAAWRVVEFHLNADEAIKDNVELRRYLRRAVALGVTVDREQGDALVASRAVTEEELASILGYNHSQDARRHRQSLSPYLQLTVNIDGELPSEDGPYFQYLREVAQFPEAPGRVFRELASEALVRFGRWAGEGRAITYLEEAVRRGDGEAQRRLGKMLVRYRDDPRQIGRADGLLADAAARFDVPQALGDLEALYRCQVNDAPRLDLAEHWATSYRAAFHKLVPISDADLTALSPLRDPETIAQIQTHGLDERPHMLAAMGQRAQSARFADAEGLRFWARYLNRSNKALEEFAKKEMELALTPGERDLAIELFRRVYLNNGVTSALDLAIALVEYNGRAPDVAAEIEALLLQSANRGEGAAMRLYARLHAEEIPTRDVYGQFAEVIEERGDFLALMFAIPYIEATRVDDYVDRAVSLMNCATKDAAEIADAYTIHGDRDLSYHWLRIGLTFEGGHVLSKLRLNNNQMGWYDRGAAPNQVAKQERNLAEGDPLALLRLVELTANPNGASYAPDTVGTHFAAAMTEGGGRFAGALARIYRATSDEAREKIDAEADIPGLLRQAAQAGDATAALELGLLERNRATSQSGLVSALSWIEASARSGHVDGMYELGYALGFGLGAPADIETAVTWLDRADMMGHQEAAALAGLLRASHRN